jgi:hypothetical protein
MTILIRGALAKSPPASVVAESTPTQGLPYAGYRDFELDKVEHPPGTIGFLVHAEIWHGQDLDLDPGDDSAFLRAEVWGPNDPDGNGPPLLARDSDAVQVVPGVMYREDVPFLFDGLAPGRYRVRLTFLSGGLFPIDRKAGQAQPGPGEERPMDHRRYTRQRFNVAVL